MFLFVQRAFFCEDIYRPSMFTHRGSPHVRLRIMVFGSTKPWARDSRGATSALEAGVASCGRSQTNSNTELLRTSDCHQHNKKQQQSSVLSRLHCNPQSSHSPFTHGQTQPRLGLVPQATGRIDRPRLRKVRRDLLHLPLVCQSFRPRPSLRRLQQLGDAQVCHLWVCGDDGGVLLSGVCATGARSGRLPERSESGIDADGLVVRSTQVQDSIERLIVTCVVIPSR